MYLINRFLSKDSSLSNWLWYISFNVNKINENFLKRFNNLIEISSNIGLLDYKFPFVFTITGTNGKGTIGRVLEYLLISNSYKVGIYSSPHLMNYKERIRIQGKFLSDELHVKSLFNIKKYSKGYNLSYFEYSTLSALYLFMILDIDIIILEVGIGGRLDATNIINPDISIISNISYDHVDLLGNSLKKIAIEKFGIFRSSKIVVIGDYKIYKLFLKYILNYNVISFFYKIDWCLYKNFFFLFKKKFKKKKKIKVCYLFSNRIPLRNISISLFSIFVSPLLINKQSLLNLSNISLLGRFQTIKYSPRIIVDVAHNPHASKYLYRYILNLPKFNRIYALVGILNNKDVYNTFKNLFSIVNYWYCCTLSTKKKGMSGIKLSKYIDHYIDYLYVFNSIQQAFLNIKNKIKKNDLLIVFGSFNIVSNFINIFYN